MRDINAKSDNEREMLHFEFEKLADEDPEGFEKALIASARKTLSDIKELKIKEQIAKVSEIVTTQVKYANIFRLIGKCSAIPIRNGLSSLNF